MAAGEYVSVSSQASSEAADLKREQRALRERPGAEKAELAHIYQERGVQPKLAREVADQLMAKDALAAHARDELGLSEAARRQDRSRPPGRRRSRFRSARHCRRWRLSSRPSNVVVLVVPLAALIFLVALGAVGARAGGAPGIRPALAGRLLGRAGDGGDGGHRRAGREGDLERPAFGSTHSLRS